MSWWVRQQVRALKVVGWSICLSLQTTTAFAVERYEGVAYSPDNMAIAYRETHWLYREGDVDRRLVLYRCADGTAFARKRLTEFPSAAAPDFEFYDAGIGYREGVTGDGRHRTVFAQGPGALPLRQRELDLEADDVVDAGFDAYIRAHWGAITPRQPLRAAIIVPGRLEAVPVVISETRDGDAGLRRLVMRLDTWYGVIVPSRTLDYESDSHRLLAFRGIGMVRDVRGRNLDVRIRFPPERHESVGLQDVRAAEQEALSGTCHP